MKKALFTMNEFNYPHIGYTKGDNWNGWATPHFEIDEALSIMEEFNRDSGNPMWYDEQTDTFRVAETEYTDEYVWRGRNCHTDDGVKHLYGIGAYSWTWEDTTYNDIYIIAQIIEDHIWEFNTYEYRDQYDDRDELIDKIISQIKELKTLKQVIIYLYNEELTAEELFNKLGGILKI